MKISGSTALVTGASRGLGRHFARQLVERGAARVYATARNPGQVDVPGADVLALDITDPASVTAAAAVSADVTLLVNNAGVSTYQNLVTGDLGQIRQELDTHLYGTLAVIRAFAPVLAANGGGAILNVLSRMSWLSYDGANSYAVAKAAEWSLTNGVRLELARQGTLVSGVLLSATDTDMMAGWDIPKNDPADVVRQALDGIEDGLLEIIADEDTAQAKAALSADPAVTYGAQLAAARGGGA
jgi:NAD(P)-dependent dehydrogenase (short-subunit alcohol dehydrogenase family)